MSGGGGESRSGSGVSGGSRSGSGGVSSESGSGVVMFAYIVYHRVILSNSQKGGQR